MPRADGALKNCRTTKRPTRKNVSSGIARVFHQTTHRRPHCCFPNAPHDMPPMLLLIDSLPKPRKECESSPCGHRTLLPWLDRRRFKVSPQERHACVLRVRGDQLDGTRNLRPVRGSGSWLGCLRVGQLARPAPAPGCLDLLSFGVTGMAFTALPRLRAAATPCDQSASYQRHSDVPVFRSARLRRCRV